MTKNQRSRSRVVVGPKRDRAGVGGAFVAQAVAAVTLPYIVLLPLLYADRIGVLAFAGASLAISIAAMILLGRRLAESLRRSAEKEHRRAVEQIHRLACFDVLTELPNRARFRKKLAETAESARREGGTFAGMIFDLGPFKAIN